jgi:hypothetical protein
MITVELHHGNASIRQQLRSMIIRDRVRSKYPNTDRSVAQADTNEFNAYVQTCLIEKHGSPSILGQALADSASSGCQPAGGLARRRRLTERLAARVAGGRRPHHGATHRFHMMPVVSMGAGDWRCALRFARIRSAIGQVLRRQR